MVDASLEECLPLVVDSGSRYVASWYTVHIDVSQQWEKGIDEPQRRKLAGW
jgi:hypothetical protein